MSVSKQQQAYASIMHGIKEANFKGSFVPCQLLLSGDHSFPLVMHSQGHVLMAASQYGSGRIVVFSHETQMYTSPDVTTNALKWLKGDKSVNMSVGVNVNTDEKVINNLRKASFKVILMDDFSSARDVGVYLTSAYYIKEDAQNIVAFMKSGGGVLIGGQAWYWKTQTPAENTLLQFPGNKVSAVAGIHFSDLHADKDRVPIWPQIPTSWKSVDLQYDFKDDLELLLQDIDNFEWQEYCASEILVHGRLSFPIGTTEDGRAFLAGGYYGKGRVVVVAHEAFLALESMIGLWDNVLHWLDQGRQGVVGVVPEYTLKVLERSGLSCEPTMFRSDLSVFVRTAYDSDHIQDIQEFVAEGGGLLIGGHAWNWAQSNPEQNYLTEFPGNILLNQMGLSLLSGTIPEGRYKTPNTNESIKETYHFRHLLYRLAGAVSGDKALTQQEEKCLPKLGDGCVGFLHMENFNSYLYQQILDILTDILMKTGLPQMSQSSSAKSATDHFLRNIAAAVYNVCPNQEELVHHLLKDNPVLKTVRDQRINFTVNTGAGAEWVSTGLYLSPGMKTDMSIPADIVTKGWQVQISCHTDILNGKDLKRAPRVYERFRVTSELMLVHNLWGGLIYLIAPPHTQVTGVEVIVQKAVLAPHYKSGVTSLSDWSGLRSAPSPWAELEFENIILTVPSDEVRSLDRPDELAAIWDKIMRAVADLASIPHKFKRKERIVCDVQISAGWLHAGYPIMAHNATAEELVTAKESQNMWGPIHELGHNQQRACWEFRPHTTEATCNLWSVYVHETVLEIPREEAHPSLTPENQKTLIETYINKGRNLDNWNVWVALMTYLQLQERFGWDALKNVFGAYHNMSGVPRDNKEKMNLYCVTFSEVVGMDLTGFFKAWGWPIEGDTEKKLSNLPAWTDHPMAQYN
ncbi:TRPM8 channel-associated factor homolog [Eucyclogobius newberryi]|uniref:TRPM8 channel-associated factor homolog n=1 Tax=Eucyclogobius newberryi TaxID=166745 RepID=UPI003B5A31BF